MIISHNQSSNNQNLSVGDDTRQHMLLDMVNEGAAKLNGCLYCSLTHEFSSATIEEVCENYCGKSQAFIQMSAVFAELELSIIRPE